MSNQIYQATRARQYEDAKKAVAAAPRHRAHADEFKAAALMHGDDRKAAMLALADKHEAANVNPSRAKAIREAVRLLERDPLDQNAAAIIQHQAELLEATARACEQTDPEKYAPAKPMTRADIQFGTPDDYNAQLREQVAARDRAAAAGNLQAIEAQEIAAARMAPLTANDRRRIQDETREITAAATGTTV